MPVIPSKIERLFFTRDVFLSVARFIHGDCIDFGAGMSRYKHMILKRAASYTTMDIRAHPGIDIVGDALDPPLRDASFDTVVSTHVLEHVREPWVMVGQIARVLRPGGTAILMAPFMYPEHSDPHHYFNFSEAGLRALFERVGMHVALSQRYGGFFTIMSEIIKQKYFSPYGGRLPWWKRHLFSFLQEIFRLLNRLAPPGIAYANVVCVAHKPA